MVIENIDIKNLDSRMFQYSLLTNKKHGIKDPEHTQTYKITKSQLNV